MKAHSGQVAVFLALVLVAIVLLVLMNVNVFLSVSARNKTMNGGDAAALAVARHQGELLNQIGAANIDHLKAALRGDFEACAEITDKQLRWCFWGPLDGIAKGNDAARKNGCERNDVMLAILKQHAFDIRDYYANNPDVYPAPWLGAWEEYAQHLEIAIAEGIWAGPDNIDFLDGATGHMLLDQLFYEAIAGETWCWFRFNAPVLLSSYSSFRDWGPLPGSDLTVRQRKCVNSEVYSLNLDLRVGSAVDLLGVELIAKLTGATAKEIDDADLLKDRRQAWFFYDTSVWRKWKELDPDGAEGFPSMGAIRPEYDVRGAAAICRVTKGESVWSAAAKSFGVVDSAEGEVGVVTSLNGFVTDAFTAVRLVPLDGVGGRDLSTANGAWMKHVREHLGDYLQNGPRASHGCWYCQQLVKWERDSFRQKGIRWLKYHSNDCVRSGGSGGGSGGTAHGH